MQRDYVDLDALGEGDLDDDDDEDDEEAQGGVGAPTPWEPGEMFWALKDASFTVPAGSALGVVGGPDAGKSTLLNILGRRAFPTEGRAVLRGSVSPLPKHVMWALGMTHRPPDMFNLIHAGRLLGVHPGVVKRHRAEIEALAAPLLDKYDNPAPGALWRLALATSVVLPTDLILLDGLDRMEAGFRQQMLERARERVAGGDSLVFATRDPSLVQGLCDEVIAIEQGCIVDGDGLAAGGGQPTAGARNGGPVHWPASAPASNASPAGPGGPPGQELRVPDVVPAFNESAALLAVALRTARGGAKRLHASDEISVEIRFETALRGVEASCGIDFIPRDGNSTGIRFEFPEPVRFARPRTYVVTARPPVGALGGGAYEVRADAIVANPSDDHATVIARDVCRVRVAGDGPATGPDESPAPRWDGRLAWRGEAEWTIE